MKNRKKILGIAINTGQLITIEPKLRTYKNDNKANLIFTCYY